MGGEKMSWAMARNLDPRHKMRRKLKVGARQAEVQWEGRRMSVDSEETGILGVGFSQSSGGH